MIIFYVDILKLVKLICGIFFFMSETNEKKSYIIQLFFQSKHFSFQNVLISFQMRKKSKPRDMTPTYLFFSIEFRNITKTLVKKIAIILAILPQCYVVVGYTVLQCTRLYQSWLVVVCYKSRFLLGFYASVLLFKSF